MLIDEKIDNLIIKKYWRDGIYENNYWMERWEIINNNKIIHTII
jgi:hypothetical protein